MSSVVANARGKPGGSGPFCWQSVHIVRHLREVCESSNRVSVASTQSVYLALTELGTDNRSSSFQTPISEIAKRAGLGYRVTATAVAVIQETGFLDVQSNFLGEGELRTSNTYTLIKHEPALCKFCRAHVIVKETAHPPIHLEDTSEEKKREAPLSSSMVFSEWVSRAESEFPTRADVRTIAGKFFHYYQGQLGAMCYERLVEWIKNERQPKARHQETITAEPLGWREYIAQKYPLVDFPDREKFEDGPWSSVPAYYKKMIIAGINKKSA